MGLKLDMKGNANFLTSQTGGKLWGSAEKNSVVNLRVAYDKDKYR
jgi:hypothetical protein